MKIGDSVKSSAYADLELGRIINILSFDGANYYEIYFPKSKETLTLEEKDVSRVVTPLEKLNNGEFDVLPLLKLRILSEKISALLYQDKIVAANNFKIVPLPHQVLAVNQIMGQFMPRCLIADEVGLGKTIEASLIFEELKLRNMVKRIIIITPAGLTSQWKDELKTKFNEDFTVIDRNTFEALRQIHGNVNVWKNYDHVITSLDFLKPKAIRASLSEQVRRNREDHNQAVTDGCINADWDMAIFDEAHKLSKEAEGSETSRYKIGKSLSEVTPIFLLLTATPHQGDGEKFRHLLSLIDPYKFYSPDSLIPSNVKSVTVKNKKRAATDFNGNLIFKSRVTSMVKIQRELADIEVQLYNEVSDYVSSYYNLASREGNFAFMFLLILYQRMVSSSSRAIFEALSKRLELLQGIASVFPEETRDADDEALSDLAAQEAYDELLGDSAGCGKEIIAIKSKINDEIEILTKCVILAKKASYGRHDFKVRKAIEIINEVIKRENDSYVKILIFTEFIVTQKYLGEILEGLGFKVAYLNGKMSLDKKIEAKIKFKEDYQILISTDAGGEGINLQFAHVMINYDLPWNPMKIEQRIGRLDRIGQKKDVLVFNFILKDTVEERVRDVLNEKLDRIAAQFGDDKKADVLNLLQDEFNFDRIFIEAIRENNSKIPELQQIGEEIYSRAKSIIENQEYLVPFSDSIDAKKLQNAVVKNDSVLIKSLLETYGKFSNSPLTEYSKAKGVYYSEQPIGKERLKNIVFEKELAIDNENYEYLGITHPLVQSITEESLQKDCLTCSAELTNFDYETKGLFFYYRIDLTNNQGFLRRFIVPIFIDANLDYGENTSKLLDKMETLQNLQTGINIKTIPNAEKAIETSNSVLESNVRKLFSETKLELIKKITGEQEKYSKYFSDKEKAIQNIAIPNIKESKLKELSQQRIQEKIGLERKKNLVPIIKLFAVTQIRISK